jgi:hypothetical protein
MADDNPYDNNYGRNQGGHVGWHGPATGSTKFAVRWNGDLLQRSEAIFRDAMMGLRGEALHAAQQFQEGHIRTGDMVSKLYVNVVDEQGQRIRLVIGDSSEHAIYEELGTRFRPGHPNMRRALDYMAPRIKQALAEAIARAQ